MRLASAMTKDGFFWFPGHKDELYPGTLHISRLGEVTLTITYNAAILDSSTILNNTPFDSHPKLIYGMTDNAPVTLRNCSIHEDPFYPLRFTSQHVMKSNFSVSETFVGTDFSNNECIEFSRIVLSCEGLSEWLSIPGLSFDLNPDTQNAQWSLRYKQPDDICIPLSNGLKLEFLFSPTFSLPSYSISNVSSSISQESHISLSSEKPIPIEQFYDILKKLQTFLSLIMNRLAYMEWMKGYSNERLDQWGRETTTEIFFPSYEHERPTPSEVSILCSYKDISDKIGESLRTWIESNESVALAYGLYLSSRSGVHKDESGIFLTLTHGLETFHRRNFRVTEMKEEKFKKLKNVLMESIPESQKDFRDIIAPKLEHANELPLRKRLMVLVDQFGDLYGSPRQKIAFVGKVVMVRNYLTHYDKNLEVKATKIIGESLWPICLKLDALFQLLFLHFIGVDGERIRTIAKDNLSLRHKLALEE